MTRTIFALAAALLAVPLTSQACLSNVEKGSVFHVNVPGRETINATTRDLVVMQWSQALVPANSDTRVKIEYDREVLKLIARPSIFEESHALGVQGEVLYFRVIGSGSTTVRIHKIAGTGIESVSEQEIDAKDAPVYRCM